MAFRTLLNRLKIACWCSIFRSVYKDLSSLSDLESFLVYNFSINRSIWFCRRVPGDLRKLAFLRIAASYRCWSVLMSLASSFSILQEVVAFVESRSLPAWACWSRCFQYRCAFPVWAYSGDHWYRVFFGRFRLHSNCWNMTPISSSIASHVLRSLDFFT